MAQPNAIVQEIKKYGPYGSLLPQTFDFQLAEGEHFTEFYITHGWMVDAFGFLVTEPSGSSYRVKYGGNGENHSRIVLRIGEFITRISGKSGYDTARDHEAIGSLTIHTNLRPEGYGPYGLAKDITGDVYDFESPFNPGGPIVGFFGRGNKEVESIGLFVKKI